MAVTSALLTAQQLSDVAAGFPFLVGKQSVEDINRAEWRQGGSFASGSDETDTDFPTFLAHDRTAYEKTRPDTAQTTWFLLLEWTGAKLGKFDTMWIVRHNLGTINATIDLQLADDNAFTTNLITLHTSTPANDKRIVDATLFHTGSDARLYSTVEFARLKIVTGGAAIPQIGELWLGDRQQMGHGILLAGFSPERKVSDHVDVRVRTGFNSRIVYNKGAKGIQPVLFLPTPALVTEGVNWFTASDFAMAPFLFVEDASSAALANKMFLAWEMSPNAQHFDFLKGSATDKKARLSLNLEEEAPFLSGE